MQGLTCPGPFRVPRMRAATQLDTSPAVRQEQSLACKLTMELEASSSGAVQESIGGRDLSASVRLPKADDVWSPHGIEA